MCAAYRTRLWTPFPACSCVSGCLGCTTDTSMLVAHSLPMFKSLTRRCCAAQGWLRHAPAHAPACHCGPHRRYRHQAQVCPHATGAVRSGDGAEGQVPRGAVQGEGCGGGEGELGGPLLQSPPSAQGPGPPHRGSGRQAPPAPHSSAAFQPPQPGGLDAWLDDKRAGLGSGCRTAAVGCTWMGQLYSWSGGLATGAACQGRCVPLSFSGCTIDSQVGEYVSARTATARQLRLMTDLWTL